MITFKQLAELLVADASAVFPQPPEYARRTLARLQAFAADNGYVITVEQDLGHAERKRLEERALLTAERDALDERIRLMQ